MQRDRYRVRAAAGRDGGGLMTAEQTRGDGSLETWTLAQLRVWLRTEEATDLGAHLRAQLSEETGFRWFEPVECGDEGE